MRSEQLHLRTLRLAYMNEHREALGSRRQHMVLALLLMDCFSGWSRLFTALHTDEGQPQDSVSAGFSDMDYQSFNRM